METNTTTTFRTIDGHTTARIWDVYQQQWRQWDRYDAIPSRVLASLTAQERDTLRERLPEARIACQSGDWSGETCHAPAMAHADAIRMAFVPDFLRDTATAAGSWRGVEWRIRVCPDCAEQMQEHDAEWVRICR